MFRFLRTPLLACASAALLAACALSPALTGTAPGDDGPVFRHALVRQPQPTPQWARLQQALEEVAASSSGISVRRIEDGLRVEIPVADGFTFASSKVEAPLAAVLDRLASVLAEESGLAVTVIGHTDSQGSEMFNLRLSIERAEAVVAHLIERGLAPEHLHADGRGEADPLASNATETGRARNRRVELILRASS